MALELILGSMYSGKSTELIRRIQRLKSIGMRCCVINHVNDTRVAGDFIQTHDGNKFTAIKTDDLLLTEKVYCASIQNYSRFHSDQHPKIQTE